MTPGKHVFGENRVGCWMMNPANLPGRLVPMRRYATDLYLPREASLTDMSAVRAAGFSGAHLFTIPHGRDAATYAEETLADVTRLKPGALELNVEIPDQEIAPYLREVMKRIRAKRKALRTRVNIAPMKAGYLPRELVHDDPNFFVISQAYRGNMDDRVAEDALWRHMVGGTGIGWGLPEAKCSIMYGAHVSPEQGDPRVASLPVQGLTRGSIYNDDLMNDAGYL